MRVTYHPSVDADGIFQSSMRDYHAYTIVDDDWHAMHPSAATQLFGFETWTERQVSRD
jgi:hypothetical protein